MSITLVTPDSNDDMVVRDANGSAVALLNTTGLTLQKAAGTGVLVDLEAPTFGYRDITGDIAVKGVGVNDPVWSVFRDGLLTYEFDATTMKQVWICYHIPHDYVPGTDIFFHAHWGNHNEVPNTGTVIWGFEYVYARGFDQQVWPASTTITVSKACHAARYMHQISETAAVTLPNLEPDGILYVRVYRDATADTCTDDVHLFTADLHYQSTNIATKNRNFPFNT